MESADMALLGPLSYASACEAAALQASPEQQEGWPMQNRRLLECGQGQQMPDHLLQLSTCPPPQRAASVVVAVHRNIGLVPQFVDVPDA